MKCSNVRKEIERLVYRDGPDPGAEVFRHLENCVACSRYLEETRLAAAKIAGLRSREPVLKDPRGLTEDIMKAIRKDSKEVRPGAIERPGKLPVVIILRRLLAAASVCLFLVFTYEEYVVVEKISRLEKQCSAISQSSQYQSALNLKKAIGIFLSDPEMQSRYKELKARKISIRALLNAAIYVDVAGLGQDPPDLPGRFDNKTSDQIIISILKKLDSTPNNIQR